MPARNNQIECSEGCQPCNPECQVLRACPDFLRLDDKDLYQSEDWRQRDPDYPAECWEMDKIRAARMMR